MTMRSAPVAPAAPAALAGSSMPALPEGLRPLAQAPAPAADEVLGTWQVESTAQLRALRAGLACTLDAARAVAGPVVLVASELATNALRHGGSPALVSLSRSERVHLLDVADDAVDAVPAVVARRPLGEGGYGLYLVGRLAGGVGWYVAAGRKHVWASFPR
jgi:anti-sigma regulatory factor (Ser/Thr protein kinase)